MENLAFTYSIVDSFSIAFLLILFVSTRDRSSRLTDNRCFRIIVIMAVVALLGDMIAWQLDGRAGHSNRIILWVVNILCYILSGAMGLTWLYYVALKMNRLGHISRLGWMLIAFPYVFLSAASLLTPWTQWLFYLNGNNAYQRGALFFIQMIIPFGYLLAAALWTLHRATLERLRQQRSEYLLLSSFILFPLLGGILQLVIYGVSIAWPCTALSLMLVYVSMQNQKISLDALTGLNNRGQLDKHLFNCFERGDDGPPFALFMLDIDEFKKINDTLGHTAGDAALIDAANVLKRSLISSKAFLARYGGDEFAVVLYYTTDEQIAALLARITAEAERHNGVGSDQYRLVFSVGYACYDKNRYKNYQDMITAADAHMYKQKQLHKALRREVGK